MVIYKPLPCRAEGYTEPIGKSRKTGREDGSASYYTPACERNVKRIGVRIVGYPVRLLTPEVILLRLIRKF